MYSASVCAVQVDYVLVVFGGVVGYKSDDINKFLWMVRIAGGTNANPLTQLLPALTSGVLGVFSHVSEAEFLSTNGEYSLDSSVSDHMKQSLMYKLSYYRFGQVQTLANQPLGYDRVRECEIGHKEFNLTHLEEAFTTEHWLVRIYRLVIFVCFFGFVLGFFALPVLTSYVMVFQA